jgi:hypothetical protein
MMLATTGRQLPRSVLTHSTVHGFVGQFVGVAVLFAEDVLDGEFVELAG